MMQKLKTNTQVEIQKQNKKYTKLYK